MPSEIPALELCSATSGSLFLAEGILAGCDLLPSSGKESDLFKYKPNFYWVQFYTLVTAQLNNTL